MAAFDKAFWGHVGHIFKNLLRAKWRAVTFGVFASSPVRGPEARYYKDVARYSAAFALLADVALGTLGGSLKRKEHISGRFADAFAWMFLATAALKHFHDQGRPQSQRAYLNWSCSHALYECERALVGVLDNLPNRFIARLMRLAVFPYGAKQKSLSDAEIEAVADAVLFDHEARAAITSDIFIPGSDQPGMGKLESALGHIHAAQPARDKISAARRHDLLRKGTTREMAQDALSAGLINQDELNNITHAEKLRDAVIQVADFDPDVYLGLK